MTPNEFVKLYMQNCQYRNEVSLITAAIAEENDLVVVFGASDDLCEIRGAEDDEIDCFDGGEATIAGAKVKINWCKDGYSWTYDTDIPHECFDVYADGEKYCRGIVFSLSDVKQYVLNTVPVKHGHWYNRGGRFRCSVCNNKALLKDIVGTGGWSHEYEQQKSPYCPNCGAKMDNESEEK